MLKMNDWLDAPAGKHGFVRSVKDKLLFEDGRPVKFWGANISGKNVFTTAEKADFWAKILATYGVNGVRLHKFTQAGLRENISTQLKDEKYERLDYFCARLKEKGIYYGWSPIYGHKPKIGDRAKLMAYKEITAANLNNHLSYSTIGLVNFAEDLQNLHIELIVNLLNHKNTHTGLRYADDPALLFVELQNEDNIFFATTAAMIEKCPTYKNLLTEKFTIWLKKKYGDQKTLKKAWGNRAFAWGKEVKNINWNLDKKNITPVVNHGIYDYEYKKAHRNNQPLPRFLSDMAIFLFGEQTKYYNKCVEAIRKTGYKGLIITSNWQAGSGVSHYLNLLADDKTGIIDRHNYFGGGTGHTLAAGKFNNQAMVSDPGSGLLSAGMQQVLNRPFSCSEWMSIIPNEWTAEAGPVIAVYGLGLQGWDMSFSFDSQTPFFTPTIHIPNAFWPSVYNVMTPTQLGLYPALARMVYRNDVQEGRIVSNRYVCPGELVKGNVGFYENMLQDGDIKNFEGFIPPQTLAAGRVAVKFTDASKKTPQPDLAGLWDKPNRRIISNTKQLEWNYAGKGYFTVNTPGTKGVVGFAKGIKINLDYLSIIMETPFAIVLLTSPEKNKSIEESKRILATTIARAKNSCMTYNPEKTELLEVGNAPILLEPVVTKLSFDKFKLVSVIVLDHAGKLTDIRVPVENNAVLLDGTKYKTLYYLIELE